MCKWFRIQGSGFWVQAVLVALSNVFLLSGCPDSKNTETPVDYTYKVVKTYPHEPNAFTQGLVFEDGFLYESTGLNGHSSLRKVELETGKILKFYNITAQFFAEGITIYNNKIIQLTYKSNVGFVYNKNTFELLQKFDYPTEGWGITHDGKRLIMSDGTSTLYFLNPDTLKRIGQINVEDNGKAVSGLNELEYIKGQIYANVWPTEQIVIISPSSGKVVGRIYMNGLSSLQQKRQPIDVLNGIAYDAEKDRIFVTGKFWPTLFEIKLVPLK
jgi:glutamine cyclotransferase